MEDRRILLAVDLGTSGSRVIAFSSRAQVVAKAYFEFPSSFPQPGWVEQDPEALWEATARALKEVLSKISPADVVSLGVTNQRETTILWEKKTGRPIGNAIVWQDRRTEPLCRQLEAHETLIRERTGLRLDPYFSATKIAWMAEHTDGLRERMRRGEICFGTPDVWLVWKLTGGKVFATEPSNASRTLLFNIRTLRFDHELLKVFDLPEAILPEVRDSDAAFGVTAAALTGREIPIRGILGDQQAALFAHGAWEPGIVKNTYGTGLFLLSNTGPRILQTERLLTTVAWKMRDRLDYAVEGSILMGGAVLNWLRDQLGILPSFSESGKIAASVADNEGVYFVPALQGMGAPYWDPAARGAIFGITRKTTRATLVRAALESLAYQSRDVVEEMARALGEPIRTLRVDGGGAQNEFLMQFQADILGLPVERANNTDTTALGAAGISGVASGVWDRDAFSQLIRSDKIFKPRLAAEQRETFYRHWTEAVSHVVRLPGPSYGGLNKQEGAMPIKGNKKEKRMYQKIKKKGGYGKRNKEVAARVVMARRKKKGKKK
jgi:glycerol kinase